MGMGFLAGPLPETPSGKKYVITVTDYVSKWPKAGSLPDKTALGIAVFLFSLLSSWVAEVIISDQGREFVNEVSRYTFCSHVSMHACLCTCVP